MAIHNNYESMLKESLNEMLKLAFIGVNSKKEDGGIYGYPVTLILFCIADAISTWSGYKKHSLSALKDERFYNFSIDADTLVQIRKRYRDLLAHHLVIGPGDILIPYGSTEEVFKRKDDGSLIIAVRPFYSVTMKAVENFISLMPTVVVQSGVNDRLSYLYINRSK